jgi:hypothetical protein
VDSGWVAGDRTERPLQGQAITGGTRLKDRVQFAFGAEFVEVRVHARTREIRVPRLVGALTRRSSIHFRRFVQRRADAPDHPTHQRASLPQCSPGREREFAPGLDRFTSRLEGA